MMRTALLCVLLCYCAVVHCGSVGRRTGYNRDTLYWRPSSHYGDRSSTTTTQRTPTARSTAWPDWLWDSLTTRRPLGGHYDNRNYGDRPSTTTQRAPTARRTTTPPEWPWDSYKPQHCHDLWNEGHRTPGVFTIYPDGVKGVKVWCEHGVDSTATVFQRRQFGNVSFVQPWAAYKSGFGDPRWDHWVGLDTLYFLTYQYRFKLSIALQDWNGKTSYMTYSTFSVASEASAYRLTISSGSGPRVDDMSYSNNMPFATFDRPDVNQCASNQHVGWWYNYCAFALLNGKYYYGGRYSPPAGFYDGIYWKDWYGYDYSLKFVSMALVL